MAGQNWVNCWCKIQNSEPIASTHREQSVFFFTELTTLCFETRSRVTPPCRRGWRNGHCRRGLKEYFFLDLLIPKLNIQNGPHYLSSTYSGIIYYQETRFTESAASDSANEYSFTYFYAIGIGVVGRGTNAKKLQKPQVNTMRRSSFTYGTMKVLKNCFFAFVLIRLMFILFGHTGDPK